MDIDLDRYYTPLELAESLIAQEYEKTIESCVDTTCGSGNLLLAADNIFDNLQCIGLDRDRNAITALRRKQPNWTLSVADLMKTNSYRRTAAVNNTLGSDLLLLNPPFSHGKTKTVDAAFGGSTFKASVAMGHILRSLDIFEPTAGALVIVPESVLYSDTDSVARTIIQEFYSIEKIAELDTKTFSGARVRSTAIKFLPGKRKNLRFDKRFPPRQRIKTLVTRGGLPTHISTQSGDAAPVPFIHSTDMKDVISGRTKTLPSTTIAKRGRVSGPLVLIPRVGKPNKELIQAVYIDDQVQLSDCVIALHFSSLARANAGASRIRKEFESLEEQYRGTGARYITLGRLQQWLVRLSFSF